MEIGEPKKVIEVPVPRVPDYVPDDVPAKEPAQPKVPVPSQ
jgi:hypothetical protein